MCKFLHFHFSFYIFEPMVSISPPILPFLSHKPRFKFDFARITGRRRIGSNFHPNFCSVKISIFVRSSKHDYFSVSLTHSKDIRYVYELFPIFVIFMTFLFLSFLFIFQSFLFLFFNEFEEPSNVYNVSLP